MRTSFGFSRGNFLLFYLKQACVNGSLGQTANLALMHLFFFFSFNTYWDVFISENPFQGKEAAISAFIYLTVIHTTALAVSPLAKVQNK